MISDSDSCAGVCKDHLLSWEEELIVCVTLPFAIFISLILFKIPIIAFLCNYNTYDVFDKYYLHHILRV